MQGLPAAPSLLAVDGPVDLAVIAVPAPAVLPALKECAFAVKQAGAVRARSVEELFDLARGLASQPLPRGRRLLVVTNGGGLGIVATDAARDSGLEMLPLDDATRQRLRAVLPLTASVGNPVDLVGDADAARYGNALHTVAACADAVLVILTAQAVTDSLGVARAVLGTTRGWPIPVVAAFVGGARIAPGVRALEEGGIPCYPFPEPAVAALAGMALLAERRRKRPAEAPAPVRPADVTHLASLLRTGAVPLDLLDLTPLLESYGIRVAVAHLAATPEEARTVAEQIGFPVALKVVSPGIIHKTEVGGVQLGLRSPSEVADATRAMMTRVRAARLHAAIHGVLVQPMVPAGKELLLGVVRDPQFGPLVMVRFGGIYVEVLNDTATRLAPLGRAEALAMLDQLRMAPALRGVRGEAPVDRAALAETICRFAQIAIDCPEVAELELNPVIAGARGVIALDARATLKAPDSVRGGSPGYPEESRQE